MKKSFTLHEDVIAAADAAVVAGEAENLSAFVETAIQEKLLRSKRAQLYRSYEAAASDAKFMEDMNATARAYRAAAADGLRDA